MISFYFYHRYFHTRYIIPNITYSFKLIIIFFFLLFKKCPDISNYFTLMFLILLFFFLSSFSFLVPKSIHISLIISSFNLSQIIFGFFPIKFCLIDLIFFIFCSPSLSISSLDTIIAL